MPHKCTNCDTTYETGSEALLEGCQNCPNNTFQFVTDDTPQQEEADTEDTQQATENEAQKSARSTLVTDNELSDAEQDDTSDDMIIAESDTSHIKEAEPDNEAESESIDDLRDQLNDEFEGVRIVEPGQYELNLRQLYEQQDVIIQLYEDGRYAIQTPDIN